ncbi:hypothetical protein LTR32_006474 [Rachicladosporium monterosium]|uniref:Uncharacterized protein n=1 Tax=Rachicladosporium monterosium TaxID=1507873 RepID=A0ABR0L0U9_9PEZI|nr:hypothetical protein LTR32_006474 [Rachicladosporium monterosium]
MAMAKAGLARGWARSCCNGISLLIVGSSIVTLEMVSHGFGEPQDDLSTLQVDDIWVLFLVAQLLFYAGAACSLWTVVEFMVQLKGTVRVPLLTIIRYASVTWGVAGIVIMATFVGIQAKSPVRIGFLVLDAFGCALQLAVFVAAVLIIWPLQMTVSRRLTVLTGFTPGFAAVAALIAAMTVTPNPKADNNFSRSSNDFIVATQVAIMFLMINSTAAPLLQVGRKLGAGNDGPFIGYTGGTACGSGGSGLRSKKHVAIRDAYDMDNVTRAKLGPGNVEATVQAAGDPYTPNGRMRGLRSGSGSGRDIDGLSVESDSSRKIIIRKTVEQQVTSG